MKMRSIPVSAVDLFALLVVYMVIMCFLLVLQINESKKKDPTAKPRAEFLVKTNWKEVEQDIDLWIRRKGHAICGYSRREIDVFLLVNDHTSNTYGRVEGKNLTEGNEVLTILKKQPGFYQISIHGFRVRNNTGSCPVIVSLEQVDPYNQLFKTEVDCRYGLEVPICEFTIDNDGKVINFEGRPEMLSKFLHIKGN